MSDATAIAGYVATELEAYIGTRIYPLVLPPQPTLPAIAYQLVSAISDEAQDSPGLAECRYRFTIWTDRYIDLDAIAVALKAAFFGHPEPFPAGCVIDTELEDRDLKSERWRRVVDVLAQRPA